MAVSAIKNEQTNNKKKASYVGSVIAGAASAYSLKWLLPVTKAEKDEYYFDELKNIGQKASEGIKKELKKIKDTTPNNTELDTFLKIFDRNNTQKIDKNFSNEVIDLLTRVKDKALTIKQIEKAKLSNYIKSIRPTAPFIFIGTFIGLSYAITKNIICSKQNKTD